MRNLYILALYIKKSSIFIDNEHLCGCESEKFGKPWHWTIS